MFRDDVVFTKAEVNAALKGKKTQFRTLLKAGRANPNFHSRAELVSVENGIAQFQDSVPDDDPVPVFYSCPYGAPGDIIWVKERFVVNHAAHSIGPAPKSRPKNVEVLYEADGPAERTIGPIESDGKARLRWRAASTMPKWASRLRLTIESIRAQRIQNISIKDVLAEGVHVLMNSTAKPCSNPVEYMPITPQMYFAHVWDEKNLKINRFEKNKYVWVIDFKTEVIDV